MRPVEMVVSGRRLLGSSHLCPPPSLQLLLLLLPLSGLENEVRDREEEDT